MSFSTPLRYPGGKGRLANYVAELIDCNALRGAGYAEPFCGGAGIALSLLFAERVSKIFLNDADRSVYSFWHTAVHHTERLLQLLSEAPLNMDEWHRQRAVQSSKETADLVDLGFSTLYLNRTNRSGIILGGVIGGKEQTGKWKIDARFNKKELKRRIELIGLYADAMKITNHDVKDFIDVELLHAPVDTLVYFDPPYYQKGQKLYKNHFTWEDHVSLAGKIDADVRQPWIISYDNVDRISDLYRSYTQERFSLNYSANGHYVGGELMIFGENVATPERVYSSRALVA